MLYRKIMKETLERQANLRLVQAEIVSLGTIDDESGKRVCSVTSKLGVTWEAERVIICSGTFLESAIFVGNVSYAAGPDGLMPSEGLSASLAEAGVSIRRFKTGTPPRVALRSIAVDRLELQPGEDSPVPFSADTVEYATEEQIPCYIVYTNSDTHRIIRDNLGRSAMYSGSIHGIGPRYCPSIEDKLVRFADKDRHQLFVEPTGADTGEMYIQGFSTSMPAEVQEQMLHSLEGFADAEIMRYAYAIEYDCADPTQLRHTLEFKHISGLYGAGQFNGTSGYEEAAAQGLVAGINAALACLGREQISLARHSSYIGTLIDDLVIKGTNEPYRMMTARSEYRLLLRQDNADLRLTDIGREVGLIDDDRYARFCARRDAVNAEVARIESTFLPPSAELNALLESFDSARVTTGARLSELLRRPELDYDKLAPVDRDRPELPRNVALTAQTEIKYAGYIKRQLAEAERRASLEGVRLPDGIDYKSIKGLRLEAAQKLDAIRPADLGAASRISGVNPADVSVLLIWLKSGRK